MKKIIIADNAGYCFGVKRAMNMAWNELEKNMDSNRKIYALGPLIHNKQAVSKYEEKGLVTIEKISEIEDINSEMIIRSHGVSKEIYDEAQRINIDIVDTTCPFVKKIHYIVKDAYEKGKKIIVIGDKNHPEVIGIVGWCNNDALIFKDINEIDFNKILPDFDYVLVSQTTMNEVKFNEIVELLNNKKLNLKIENTICSATRIRQQSARELAEKVDFMIVIGGKHSSNTQKLVKICEEIVSTFSIETKDDLVHINLDEYETVGLTAGASTPDWIIEEVISYLEEKGGKYE